MKINFDRVLHEVDGEMVYDRKKKPLTVRTAMVDALQLESSPIPKTIEQKTRRYKIAVKIFKKEDLSLDEIQIAREALAEFWSPMIVGLIDEIIEGAT